MVFRTCLTILGDHQLAQDATQETFLCFLRHRDRLTGCVAAWLHCTARCRAIDALRGEQRRHRLEDPARANLRRVEPAAPMGRSDDSSRVPLLRKAMRELESDDRRLVHRHFVEQVNQTTLAEEMRVSQATISRRLGEALRRLRARVLPSRR